jgi:hypothetical protein
MTKTVSVSDLRNRYVYVKELVDKGFEVHVQNSKTKVIDFIILPSKTQKTAITTITLDEEFATDEIINFEDIDPYEISKQNPDQYNIKPKYRLNY